MWHYGFFGAVSSKWNVVLLYYNLGDVFNSINLKNRKGWIDQLVIIQTHTLLLTSDNTYRAKTSAQIFESWLIMKQTSTHIRFLMSFGTLQLTDIFTDFGSGYTKIYTRSIGQVSVLTVYLTYILMTMQCFIYWNIWNVCLRFETIWY